MIVLVLMIFGFFSYKNDREYSFINFILYLCTILIEIVFVKA